MYSDNKFGKCCGCPAQMSDKRLFTNYLENIRLNQMIKQNNGIYNNHDYRLWLQKNALTLMKNELSFNEHHKKCNFTRICNKY